MNFKTTYVLFGLLILMLGLLALVLYEGPNKSAGTGYVFPVFHGKDKSVKSDDITRLVIERKTPSESAIVFERDEDKNWKMTEPKALPTDSSAVSRLVEAIASGAVSRTTTSRRSLKDAGLDSPTRIIKLSGNDIDLKLSIGRTTLGDDNAVTYVLASSQSQTPLAVRKSDLAAALEGVNYFRAKNLLGDNSNDVRDIKLSLGKKGTVELHKEKELWRMVQPPYGDVDVGTLLGSITSVTVNHASDKDSDFVKDGVKDLAEYNLDPTKADVLRIEVTRGEDEKAKTTAVLVGISKKLGDAKTGEKYYATLDEGQTKDIVKISSSSVEPFIKLLDDPGALRSKNLVQLEGFKTPDAIDVENSYGKLEFRKPDATKPWELYRGTSSTTVDESEVRQLINALNKKDQVATFPDPKRKKELGLEKPEPIVTIWADSLDKPDPKKPGKPSFKKDVKETAVLRFGNREGSNVAVERVWGGVSTIVMVPGTLLDIVRKGPLAYFDKAIPPFNKGAPDEDVTKIELTRNGDSIEIVREKPTDPWKLAKPTALKDRKASDLVVREVLAEMNRLMAREIVAEKVDAAESGQDLTTWRIRPIASSSRPPRTRKRRRTTFDLGKEVPGKGVYLKTGGQGHGVSHRQRGTRRAEEGDPRHHRVRFRRGQGGRGQGHGLAQDRAQRHHRGDGEKGRQMGRQGLQRRYGKADGPADRPVPSPRRALRAIRRQGAEAHRQRSGNHDHARGQKELELTIGGLDGTANFASSEQLKGDVFLVAKDLFEEAHKAPAYFREKK